MPAITMEMLAATSSYSSKLAKPCFLAMLSSSACILGSGLSELPCIFSATAAMSFCAAMNPSICLSVSLTCLTAPCATADAGEVRERDRHEGRDHQSEHLLHGGHPRVAVLPTQARRIGRFANDAK